MFNILSPQRSGSTMLMVLFVYPDPGFDVHEPEIPCVLISICLTCFSQADVSFMRTFVGTSQPCIDRSETTLRLMSSHSCSACCCCNKAGKVNKTLRVFSTTSARRAASTLFCRSNRHSRCETFSILARWIASSIAETKTLVAEEFSASPVSSRLNDLCNFESKLHMSMQ